MALKEHKGVFVLLVNVEFANKEDTAAFLEAFKPLAEHCRLHEPNTLMYEAAVDDSTGTKVVIMERYVSKADLTEVHQKSAPFLAFKDHPVQKLVVAKSGQSYLETNVGFAVVPSKGY
jgi:quinol monooxygenase YgiN